MKISSLDDLITIAKSKPKRRIVVAAASDEMVLKAVYKAYLEGIVEPILIGIESEIRKICDNNLIDVSQFEIINEKDPAIITKIAVRKIKNGEAAILMKGKISSAPLLKAILDKKEGLKKSDLLSHFALMQTSYYHKVFGITDAGMNINPSLHEKIKIIENATEVFHKLGNAMPKIAILGPLETVNEKIQSTVDAFELKKMQLNNMIKGCIIDGPFALDNAVSKKAARFKGIISDVAGDADILVVPDLNSGNILYKSLIFLSDAISAAIITGAQVPVVLTSRADSDRSKLYSIALAAALD